MSMIDRSVALVKRSDGYDRCSTKRRDQIEFRSTSKEAKFFDRTENNPLDGVNRFYVADPNWLGIKAPFGTWFGSNVLIY